MAFCPNCGNEIGEGAEFCGNCGNKINRTAKANKPLEIIGKIDFKGVLKAIKEYFLHFYVDYNSKLFKYAMIIFLAIGIGEPLFGAVSDILPFSISDLFTGAYSVFKFLMCGLLFGVFSILILKSKSKTTVKKSNFLMIFWIVSVALNFLVFLTESELYQYVLFSNYADNIIELLLVVSSAALIFKNKQKSPIVLIISALSFALSRSYMSTIKLYVGWYKIWKTNDYLIDVLDSLRYIILVAVLFLLVYIIPRKVSKWLVYIPALAVIVVRFISLVDYFSFESIPEFIIDVCIIVMLVLFALSCSRKVEYDYIIETKQDAKKSALKVGIISASSLAGIVVTYLLVSAIVCSVQINKGIEKWKSMIVNAQLSSNAQWDLVSEDIFKYRCTKFVSQFVDEYSFYETLKENRLSMKRISVCYSEYQSGTVDDDIVEEYSYINVDESWENDSILSKYYSKYLEMQPDIDDVDADAYINVNGGEITVTVYNNNKMPISKCTVECDFTILFIEAGYYSDMEYGRGSEIIEVENIGGGSKVSKTISFNPDEYYDGYGSYMMASLYEKGVGVISIE